MNERNVSIEMEKGGNFAKGSKIETEKGSGDGKKKALQDTRGGNSERMMERQHGQRR